MNDLNKTVDKVRIKGKNNVEEFFTWVDAEYAIQYDIKSKT